MDVNRTQHTTGNDHIELVVKTTSPLILPAGIVGNILFIWILVQTRARYLSFANYFTTLALTDLLQLCLSLLPRYVESYVHARFDFEGHLMCRLSAFIFFFLFAASSLLLAAMTAQRAAGVAFPHRVKTASSDMFSYIVICIVFVFAAILACHVLVKGQLHYMACYLGSMVFGQHNRSHGGKFMTWVHFLTVFLLPFFVIIVSNYLLICRVKASRRSVHKQGNDVSQSEAASNSGHWSLIRQHRWTRAIRLRLALFVRSMSSITAILVATSLFFCVSMMPAFLLKVLMVGEFISMHSISPLTRAVLDQLVFLNSSSKFYLYCMTGRGFRHDLRGICRRLVPGKFVVSHSSYMYAAARSSDGRFRAASFVPSSRRPSATPTPSTTMTYSQCESKPTPRQRQSVRFEDHIWSQNGQPEPRRHSESATTIPHLCHTSSEPVLSTPSHDTEADTLQAGETVPSEHLDSLPLSGVDMEAEGSIPDPGQTVELITVLQTNSEDLSHCEDGNRQSIEEHSLAAFIQKKFQCSSVT